MQNLLSCLKKKNVAQKEKKTDRKRRKNNMEYSPEARTILNLLQNFGSLTREQVHKIYEGTKFNADKLISFLCKARATRVIEDNIIVLQNNQRYDQRMLNCIWVMLDRIKSQNLLESVDLMSAKSSKDDNMTDICFINDGKRVEYITFLDTSDMSKVVHLQSTFYTSTGVKKGEEEKAKQLFVFVCKDEEVMEKLSEMELTIPFMVAFIEGNFNEIPSVDYYKLS